MLLSHSFLKNNVFYECGPKRQDQVYGELSFCYQQLTDVSVPDKILLLRGSSLIVFEYLDFPFQSAFHIQKLIELEKDFVCILKKKILAYKLSCKIYLLGS